MLVYGGGKHLREMAEWHPEFMGQVERIYEQDEGVVLLQLDWIKAEVVSADALKKLPVGTRIAISNVQSYRVAEAQVMERNSGLECVNFDEECAAWYVRKAKGQQAEMIVDSTQHEHKLDVAAILRQRASFRRFFWGASVRQPILRQRLQAWTRPGDAFIDDCVAGSMQAGLPVVSAAALRGLRGEMLVVVLDGFSTARQQLIAQGMQEGVDFIDGESLLAEPRSQLAPQPWNPLLRYAQLKLPQTQSMMVSIILPVHNQWDYTYNCLKSIVANTQDVSYEVILADDASTDETLCAAAIVKNLRIVRNEQALGFLLNTEKAATLARGKYIHFLNNDTTVHPGWLSSLVKLMAEHDDIGLTGSMLIYPDEKLQDAGGIVWQNADCISLYGRGSNPADEEYQYVRETDYLSGASILIRRSLWLRLGGFDRRYIPAYCEDNDLCFKVRQAGYKTVYQPLSRVTHYEGVSNGRELTTGLKQYQVTNSKKYVEKWKKTLSHQLLPKQDWFHARDRSFGKKTIVVLDMWIPEWDKNAGARTVYQYLLLYQQMGMHVILLSDRYDMQEPYTTAYRQMGIEVLVGQGWNIDRFMRWLDVNGRYIDYAYLQRPGTTVKYIEAFRQKTRAKLFYYPMDLQSVRQERQFQFEKRPELLQQAGEARKLEDRIFPQMDVIHVVGSREEELVRKRYPGKIVHNIPVYIYDKSFFQQLQRPTLTGRKGLIFVGSFTHTPNPDAIIWFVKKIYPLISRVMPGYPVYIVGSNPNKDIKQLSSSCVTVTGHVSDEELAAYYNKARVVIIPLRYGAGVKGKVIEAMAAQVPTVTTSIGAEGFPQVEHYIDVADTEEEYAQCVLRYLRDDRYWQERAEHLVDYIRGNFTIETAEKILREDMEL